MAGRRHSVAARLLALAAAVLLAAAPAAQAQAPPAYFCTSAGDVCCASPSASSSCPPCPAVFHAPSSLYGCGGERFDPAGRLSDWSFAGYGRGDGSIGEGGGSGAPALPSRPPSASVAAAPFYAPSDGLADAGAAFQAAIDSVSDQAVLYVPPGTYRIRRQLIIRKRVVLRGAGKQNTTLLFDLPLGSKMVRGNRWPLGAGGVRKSEYTYGSAYLQFEGNSVIDPARTLAAAVVADAPKGATRLRVALATQAGGALTSAAAVLAPGDWVRVTADNPASNAFVGRAMYAGLIPNPAPGTGPIGARAPAASFLARVVSLVRVSPPPATATARQEAVVELHRPLPFPLLPSAGAAAHLHDVEQSLPRSETGVESLTIRFGAPEWGPLSAWAPAGQKAGLVFVNPYRGWEREEGYNALLFANVRGSWVKDVRVVNADAALVLVNAHMFTASGLELAHEPRRRNATALAGGAGGAELSGSWGVHVKSGSDVLLTDFSVSGRFRSDVAVGPLAVGTVVANGRGEDLSVEPYGAGPHSTLVSNVDAGKGNRAFTFAPWWNGRRSAAFLTYWNVRARGTGGVSGGRALDPPPPLHGPGVALVGVPLSRPPAQANPALDWWWEAPAPPAGGAVSSASLALAAASPSAVVRIPVLAPSARPSALALNATATAASLAQPPVFPFDLYAAMAARRAAAEAAAAEKAAAAAAAAPALPRYVCDPSDGFRPCCLAGDATSDCARCPEGGGAATTTTTTGTAAAGAPPPPVRASGLYGCRGELFDPRDPSNSAGGARLSDWSYAGYMAGEVEIPAVPVAVAVAEYGAVGDGRSDCGPAVAAAIRDMGAAEGALLFGEGTFVFQNPIFIPKRVVLRGAGPDRTTLYFPRSLQDIYGSNGTAFSRNPTVEGNSRWTGNGSLIFFAGSENFDAGKYFLSAVVGPGARGARTLAVADTSKLFPGQWVRLVLDSLPAGGLIAELNDVSGGGLAAPFSSPSPAPFSELPAYASRPDALSFHSRVQAVGKGFVVLERTLPFDVLTTFKPELWRLESLTRVRAGVEKLTVSFPPTPYRGLGREAGFNAIGFWSTAQCWVDDVVVQNADTAVVLDRAHFCTVRKLRLTTSGGAGGGTTAGGAYARGAESGAAGVVLKWGSDVLVEDFAVDARFARDVWLNGPGLNHAVARGRAADLSVDATGGGPFGALVSAVDAGAGSRLFGAAQAISSAYGGHKAAARFTVWNVVASGSASRGAPLIPAPKRTFGPLLTAVGTPVSSASGVAPSPSSSPELAFGVPSALGWWLESPAQAVHPPDLQAAMRLARLGAPPTPLVPPPAYTETGYACHAGAPCCFWPPSSSAALPSPRCPRCPGTSGEAASSTDAAARNANVTTPSAFFGCAGELWDPARGPLQQDWSFAGYGHGRAEGLPPRSAIPVVADLKRDYGAAGDNRTDDTLAFQRALNDTARLKNGALFIPEGVYRITRALTNVDARRPLVLRGAGPRKTVLYFPRSLSEVYGNNYREGGVVGTSDHSHGTGFLNLFGWDAVSYESWRWPRPTFIAKVSQPARRGDTILRLSTSPDAARPGRPTWGLKYAPPLGTEPPSAGVVPGTTWVKLLMSNPPDGSLVRGAFDGGAFGSGKNYTPYSPGIMNPQAHVVRHYSRVVATGKDWVRLERPLPTDVTGAWLPELHLFAPLARDVGVEDLSFEFPLRPYAGHLLEAGYNALHFNQLSHSWVRNVHFVNADSGFYCWGCSFVTVEAVALRTAPEGASRGWEDGHRGIWMERGANNLVQGFNVSCRMVHDVSVYNTEQASVFRRGVGRDLNLDHHRRMSFGNLFADLDHGVGSRPFASSGATGQGPHAGSFATFWNNRGRLALSLPSDDRASEWFFGAQAGFFGLRSDDWLRSAAASPDGRTHPLGWTLERPPRLPHPDLSDAMLKTRAMRLNKPCDGGVAGAAQQWPGGCDFPSRWPARPSWLPTPAPAVSPVSAPALSASGGSGGVTAAAVLAAPVAAAVMAAEGGGGVARRL